MMGLRSLVLGEALEEVRPGFASGSDTEDGLIQFRMHNLGRGCSIDWTKLRRIDRTSREVSHLLLESGDILFNSTNSPDLVGKSAMFSGFDEPVTYSNHYLRLRVKQDILDPKYLAYWLAMLFGQGRFESMCRKWVNQASINQDQLLAMKVPYFPLTEQRRIAAILDQADALRTKRRLALASVNQLRRSIFLKMFCGENAHRNSLETIGNVIHTSPNSIRTGPFGSQLLHSEFVSEGIPVLGIDNVVSNTFTWAKPRYISNTKYRGLSRYTVKPGDVLITIMGTCGRCAVAPMDMPLAINTKHLCCMTLDRNKVFPEYLHAYLTIHPTALRYLNQVSKGAIMSGLNMELIKSMPLLLPPLSLQNTFRTSLSGLCLQEKVQSSALDSVNSLFASLQHRAFNGEL